MILNVTPGINLNAVSGPISKSQINQLGQPVVTLLPGSVVTADTNFSSLTCTDGVFPFFQNRNNSAPTDKKLSRFSHSNVGVVAIDRVNDAYTVATPLIYWDASNNTSLAGGNLNVNGSIRNITGSIQGGSDAGAWTLGAGSSTPGTAGSGAFIQLYGGGHPTFPGRTFFGSSTQTFAAIEPNGNWGFGTLLPGARVHVAGGDFLLENNRKISMPDASGSAPSLICQSDNNFVFYGTGSAGAVRPVFQMLMRSDTSPLQVNVPLKIGASGAQIASVLYAPLLSYAPAGIAASGGTQVADVTVTGDTTSSIIHVTTDSLSNNGIVIRAFYQAANTVRIVWINTTVGTVTLSAANYRVQVTNF